jgi:hypothetical protein
VRESGLDKLYISCSISSSHFSQTPKMYNICRAFVLYKHTYHTQEAGEGRTARNNGWNGLNGMISNSSMCLMCLNHSIQSIPANTISSSSPFKVPPATTATVPQSSVITDGTVSECA